MLQVVSKWVSFQRSQWKSRAELDKMQRDGLRKIVKHAYEKVPFYRKVYNEAGVNVSSVVDVASIVKLPVSNKMQLLNVPLEERTASDMNVEGCMHLSTSGVTGPPVTVLED